MTTRALGVLVLLLSVSGCETTSRASQLRSQVREVQAARAADRASADRWKAVQGPEQLGARLALAFELERAGQLTDPALVSEVAAACGADARSLETADADVDTLVLGSRWAREKLDDARLARILGCRAAGNSKAPSLQLKCADDLAATGAWREAMPHLEGAFEAGDARTRCEVVRRIDGLSPSPGPDVASFPADVVRQCRIEAAKSPAGAEPLVVVAQAKTEPAAAEAEAEAFVSGLQLGGRFGASTLGSSVDLEVGYSTSRAGFALFPILGHRALSLPSRGATTTTSFGLGASATIYFAERKPQQLVGYLRPELSVAAVWTSDTTGSMPTETVTPQVSAGLSVGAEYLLTRRLGFTVELGLHLGNTIYGVGTPVSSGQNPVEMFQFSAGGALGVVLHQ